MPRRGKPLSNFPSVEAQWDRSRNGDLRPTDLSAGSARKVWWTCSSDLEHAWQASPASRTRLGSGCPYCSGLRPTKHNNLAALYPDIAAEWDVGRNAPLTPRDVKPKSNKKVWWRCLVAADHRWQAQVNNRTRASGGRCPFCSGRRASTTNSLAAVLPQLAAQWDHERNQELTPDDVTPGSHKEVWWACPVVDDHRWRKPVNQRAQGRGCPFCANRRAAPSNSLATLFPEVAAEWHSKLNDDNTAENTVATTTKKAWWRCAKDDAHVWLAAVSSRTRLGSGCPFCSGRRATSTCNLAIADPVLALEWHPEKNGPLRPGEVTPHSKVVVWWQCPTRSDHEWRQSVLARTRASAGCPSCRSLQSRYPALADEWHTAKNGESLSAAITPGSNKKVWWRCRQDPAHEWEAPVARRALAGTGCPFCTGRKASPNYNLQHNFPSVAAEWHPTKNGEGAPTDITPFSAREVWWQCPVDSDHVWQMRVAHRTRRGSRCPSCRSLAASGMAFAEEWHPDLNTDLRIDRVGPHSPKQAWWRCRLDPTHVWRARISHRAAGLCRCPVCSGRVASPSTSLATLMPELSREWDDAANEPVHADGVTPSSNLKVRWRCSTDPAHLWTATIRNRALGSGCPFCSGREATPETSLASLVPAVAAEWHPSKNGPLTPDGVRLGSNRRVWWRCKTNPQHEWESTVANRASAGRGCPGCVLVQRSKQEIYLAFELALFHVIDPSDQAVWHAGGRLSADIILRDAQIIVEFDGSYWHRDHEARDRAKTQKLSQLGWQVVRAREHPLQLLSENDVKVPLGDNKACANMVLSKLAELMRLKPPGLDEYLAAATTQNDLAAEHFMAELLGRAVAADRKDSQMELPL